jgi:hypothetical protein
MKKFSKEVPEYMASNGRKGGRPGGLGGCHAT